jgi:hypothetical protein
MFNYEVEPALLKPFVPAGTELDAWQSKTFLSIVGFQFNDLRVFGVPVPFHSSFEEVNLRHYVRREVDGEVRHGVSFIKEIVPRRAITAGARLLYNEPYATAAMGHTGDGARSLTYSLRLQDAAGCLQFASDSPTQPLAPGSIEEFICEHYYGYTAQRDGSTLEYEVAHPPWNTAPAREALFEGDPGRLFGSCFVEALSREPSSVFYAEGSEVEVFLGKRIPASG